MIRMLSHSGWVNAETSDKEQLRHMLVPPGASLPGWSGHLPAGPRPLLPRRPTLSRVQGHRGSGVSWSKSALWSRSAFSILRGSPYAQHMARTPLVHSSFIHSFIYSFNIYLSNESQAPNSGDRVMNRTDEDPDLITLMF